MNTQDFLSFLEHCRRVSELAYSSELFWTSGTEVLVKAKTTKTIVGFAGTKITDKEDLKTNLKARKIQFYQTKVHSGFAHRAEQCLPKLLKQNPPYVLTGHSLGGAVATHLAMMVDPKLIRKVVTFGAPAIGCQKYSELVEATLGTKLIRVVSGSDLIPRLWTQKLLGYKQTKPFFYLDKNKKLYYNPSFLKKLFGRRRLLSCLFDHDIKTSYVCLSADKEDFSLPRLME